jgi:hypothetical protein
MPASFMYASSLSPKGLAVRSVNAGPSSCRVIISPGYNLERPGGRARRVLAAHATYFARTATGGVSSRPR